MAKTNIKFNNKNYSFENSLLADATARLEAHFTAMINGAEVLEGDGAEYYTLAPTPLSFRSTAPLNELQEVTINGEVVDPSNYTLEEGSTIVTFPIDYLKTLNVGNYEVDIVSESKSVKGNFTVAAPELNNHGFYYNQPYSAEVPGWGRVTFFVREDGTYDLINGYGVVSTNTYTIDGNSIVALDDNFGAFHCTISSDGTEIYCAEVQSALKLSDDISIVADDDYIYELFEDGSYYYVKSVIDRTKSSYSTIRTGINGLPTIYISENAFSNCVNLKRFTVPHFIQYVLENSFVGCINLEEIIIENCRYTQVFYIGVDATINRKHVYSNNYAYRMINASTHRKYRICDVCNSTLHSDYVVEQCEFDKDNICVNCGNGMAGLYLSQYSTITIHPWDLLIKENKITVSDSIITDADIYGDYLIIPNSITSIGDDAFYNCYALDNIIIPDSVTSIGKSAFDSCKSLKSVTIPDSVTSIGTHAFEECHSLTSVTIPDSVMSIGGLVFFKCTGLTSITVDTNNQTYKSIDGNLYSKDEENLIQYAIGKTDTSFKIPNSVTTIGEGAFYHCNSLKSVTIPNSVRIIGVAAFYGCNSLTSVTIPESVMSIRENAFYSCDNLTSVTIPYSVISINSHAFYSCTGLNSITFNGTIAQWNAIAKGSYWNYGVPATHVHCTDGDVAL